MLRINKNYSTKGVTYYSLKQLEDCFNKKFKKSYKDIVNDLSVIIRIIDTLNSIQRRKLLQKLFSPIIAGYMIYKYNSENEGQREILNIINAHFDIKLNVNSIIPWIIGKKFVSWMRGIFYSDQLFCLLSDLKDSVLYYFIIFSLLRTYFGKLNNKQYFKIINEIINQLLKNVKTEFPDLMILIRKPFNRGINYSKSKRLTILVDSHWVLDKLKKEFKYNKIDLIKLLGMCYINWNFFLETISFFSFLNSLLSSEQVNAFLHRVKHKEDAIDAIILLYDRKRNYKYGEFFGIKEELEKNKKKRRRVKKLMEILDKIIMKDEISKKEEFIDIVKEALSIYF